RDPLVTGVQTCALPISAGRDFMFPLRPSGCPLGVVVVVGLRAFAFLRAEGGGAKRGASPQGLREIPCREVVKEFCGSFGTARQRSEERRVGNEGGVRGW